MPDDMIPVEWTSEDVTTDNDDEFGFAMWGLVDGKYVLKKLTNAAFLAMIDRSSTSSTFTHLRPRPSMYLRALPNGSPFTTVNSNYDLTAAPNYDAKYSSFLVSVNLACLSNTRDYELYVLLDGEEYARIKSNAGTGADRVLNQVIIPIPASKQINIQAIEMTVAAGTYGATTVGVTLDAFIV